MTSSSSEVARWDDLARRSPSRNRTFWMPDVLSERLDALVEGLDDRGVRATRAEIVSAILFATPPEPGQLESLLREYKSATVADAHIGEASGDELHLAKTRPGPRGRA